MKKHLFVVSFFLLVISATAQPTIATDFTATDCAGITHNLFTDLDAGSVIVMVWVMPCGGCIVPAQTAFNATIPFQSSHPHRVFYFLVDDANNTACSPLNSWAIANSIAPHSTFTGAGINMTDYGAASMPKIVVLGGNSHTVFDIQDYTCDSIQVSTAITAALTANSIERNENSETNFEVTLFPNPSENEVSLTFTLPSETIVNVEVVNILGEIVFAGTTENKAAGFQKIKINTQSLSRGIYVVKTSIGSNSRSLKFEVK